MSTDRGKSTWGLGPVYDGHQCVGRRSSAAWATKADAFSNSLSLIIPLELLKLFIDRPTGWDYLCFLIARCGAAKTISEVPHEALISLFRDTEAEADREIIRRLKGYHREIMLATGGRLQAELLERGTFPSQGRGRPRKRWALRVGPSKSLLPRGKKVAGLIAGASRQR